MTASELNLPAGSVLLTSKKNSQTTHRCPALSQKGQLTPLWSVGQGCVTCPFLNKLSMRGRACYWDKPGLTIWDTTRVRCQPFFLHLPLFLNESTAWSQATQACFLTCFTFTSNSQKTSSSELGEFMSSHVKLAHNLWGFVFKSLISLTGYFLTSNPGNVN